MEFPFGQTVNRDRRKPVPDPYNPEHLTPGSWGDVDTIEIENAFVASSSSAAAPSATRTQALTSKSLYCGPDADVQLGDRIRVGSVSYQVDAKPEADVNPFTGWQPVQEIPLEEPHG